MASHLSRSSAVPVLNLRVVKWICFLKRNVERVGQVLIYLVFKLLQFQGCGSQGLNMEAVSRALELDFIEWKLEKEEKGEEVSEEQYMEEQFGLPEGLSVMDVITR